LVKYLDFMKKLAELVGVIIGDGNICYLKNLRKYYIEITGNPKSEGNYYEYLSCLFKDLIGKRGTLSLRERGLRLRVYSKKFVEYLIYRLGMWYGARKSYNIEIPEAIFNSSNDIIYSCLRGIFDTDGSFFVANKEGKLYPCIEISTCSRILAIQISLILGDDFRVNFRIKTSNCYFKGRAFVVSIYGNKQIIKWFEIIGSSNPLTMDKYKNFFNKNL
jgi:intein/homing endonuclease